MDPEHQQLIARAAACAFEWHKSASGDFLELDLLGHSLAELAEDFLLPLVVVNGSETEGICNRMKAWVDRLQSSMRGSPGALWLGSAAETQTSGEGPSLYASVNAYPRQIALKTLCANGVGALVQSPGELERVRRSGADLSSAILTSPFKTCQETLGAHNLGVGVIEVDNFPEAFEVLRVFRRSETDSGESAFTWSRPDCSRSLKLCLRVALENDPDDGGLSCAEVQSIFAQCRDLEGVEIVGVSLAWRSAVELTLGGFKKALATVRELALVCHAQSSPLDFFLVGPRSRLDPFSPASERALDLLREGLEHELCGLPLRVKLSCGDALFRHSGHLIATVTRTVPDARGEKVYLDCALPSGVGSVSDVLPLSVHRARSSRFRGASGREGCSRLGPRPTVQRFFVRDGNSHRPRFIYESHCAQPVVEGDTVVLPRVGVAAGVELNRSCTLSKPTEILVSPSCEPSVVRARVFETGLWSEEGV